MSEPTRHQGSCHCGAVRYEVTLDLSKPVITCNCSMCARSGTLLAFVPTDQFRLVAGEDALRDYRFHQKVISHLFCTTCGIKPFARGKDPQGNDIAAINVRCLEGVDLDALQLFKYDGKNA